METISTRSERQVPWPGMHLVFPPIQPLIKFQILKKRRKLEIVIASTVNYDILKHFAVFCIQFVLFHLKKVKNTQFYPKMA